MGEQQEETGQFSEGKEANNERKKKEEQLDNQDIMLCMNFGRQVVREEEWRGPRSASKRTGDAEG